MHMITRSCVLLLWSQLMTSVSSQDCTLEQFIKSAHFDSNFDVNGLDATYSRGKLVRVPCSVGYTGFFRMICHEGNWMTAGKKCELKSCGHPGDAPYADFRLEIGDDFVFGSQIIYECNRGYQMVSRSSRRRCLADGWDGIIPVCEALCETLSDPRLKVRADMIEESYMEGEVVQYECTRPGANKEGNATCQSGKWTISEMCPAVQCSAPPLLEDGDTKLVLRSDAVYQTGDKVEYICQNQYIMNGDPFQTCNNGVWEGNMRCMKPCTVNEELLSQHGLDFRFFDATKMYVPHEDHLSFVCLRGKRRVGSVPMRVHCHDGQMTLPTCQ
ncbi:complement factor H-like [Poeciliopsis prolifica]|uniref:complement factor H-like n=1 Tax=Poeciliopsis prolifica TaxID=188132 RepID=UPI002413044D|nr:complement factor H-like [Poeciliopsis prolifica]